MVEQYIPARVRWEGSKHDDYYLLGHGAEAELDFRFGSTAHGLGQLAASVIVGEGKGPGTYELANPSFNQVVNILRHDDGQGDKRLWARHGEVKSLRRREWKQFWIGFNENLAHSLARRYQTTTRDQS